MNQFRLSNLLFTAGAAFLISACGSQVKSTGEDTGLEMTDLDEDDDGTGFEWPDDDQPSNPRDDDNDGGSANMAPTVQITEPLDGDVFDVGDEISFIATISDDQDDISALDLEWMSDVIGMLSDDPSGSTEVLYVTDELEPGRHIISLEATDSEGALGVATVMITVEGEESNDDDDDFNDDDDVPDDDDIPSTDPDDSDGDGWTVEEGDCDDDNWWSYPGAEEYCDGVDNDCDGSTDENFWDDYESNNVLGEAIDLGELDHDGITGESYAVELNNLTLHEEGDEDWFRFDADDEIYDDIDLTISYEGDSSAVVTMQLFKLDWDSTVPWSEVTGSGNLEITEYGSTWDSGEDHWAVRILPFDESGADCSNPYSIRIEA